MSTARQFDYLSRRHLATDGPVTDPSKRLPIEERTRAAAKAAATDFMDELIRSQTSASAKARLSSRAKTRSSKI